MFKKTIGAVLAGAVLVGAVPSTATAAPESSAAAARSAEVGGSGLRADVIQKYDSAVTYSATTGYVLTLPDSANGADVPQIL